MLKKPLKRAEPSCSYIKDIGLSHLGQKLMLWLKEMSREVSKPKGYKQKLYEQT